MPAYLGDQLTLAALATPGAPSLSVRGTSGESTYSYKVVAIKGDGHSEASSAATTTSGPSTLTSVNAIRITPGYVQGATRFDIYRTAGGESQGKIGSLTPRNSGTSQQAAFTDKGQTATEGDAPTTNTTGQLLLPALAGASGLSVDEDGAVTSGEGGGGGGSGLQVATVNLDNDDIKALPSDGFEVVAAPGEGNAILPLFALLELDATAGAYTNMDSGSHLYLLINDTDQVSVSGVCQGSLGFNQAQKRLMLLGPNQVTGSGDFAGKVLGLGMQSDLSTWDNEPVMLVMSNAGGALTGGHASNTLRVTVYYVTRTV